MDTITRTPADHLNDAAEDLARLHLVAALSGTAAAEDLGAAFYWQERACRATASMEDASVQRARTEAYALRAELEAELSPALLAEAAEHTRTLADECYVADRANAHRYAS